MSNKYDDNYDDADDLYVYMLKEEIRQLKEREEYLQYENDVRQLMLSLTLDDMCDVFGILKQPQDRSTYIRSIRLNAQKQIEQQKTL